MLDQKTIDGLSPGVRRTVVWLNELGWKTCDSGDGSNHAAGMEGAVYHPTIVIRLPGEKDEDASRLRMLAAILLIVRQIERAIDEPLQARTKDKLLTDPRIELSYSPLDGVALIILSNIDDEFMGLAAPP